MHWLATPSPRGLPFVSLCLYVLYSCPSFYAKEVNKFGLYDPIEFLFLYSSYILMLLLVLAELARGFELDGYQRGSRLLLMLSKAVAISFSEYTTLPP